MSSAAELYVDSIHPEMRDFLQGQGRREFQAQEYIEYFEH
jgi:hypothetical protein